MMGRGLAVALVLLAMPRLADGSSCPPRGLMYADVESAPLDSPSARVVLEDLNRDGILDMVTAGSGDRVAIRLGQFAGTRIGFGEPMYVPADSTPLGFMAADLNGDQVLDLVIALRDSDRLAVALSSGRGDSWSLTPAVEYPTLAGPVGVAAGDLNGDGISDLVVGNTLANSLSAFLGRGDGTFGDRSDYLIDGKPGEFQLADVDRDGMLDAVVANVELRAITVLINNGGSGMSNGLFRENVHNPIGEFGSPSRPLSLQLADLNSDGVLDCVCPYAATGSLGLMRGVIHAGSYRLVNAGRLLNFIASTVNEDPRGIAVADFDRDGRLDIASVYTGYLSARIPIHYGEGQLRFTEAISYPGPNLPADVESADLDRDGSLDLVAVGLNSTYSISWGGCETLLSFVEAETKPGYVRLQWQGTTMAGAPATLMRATAAGWDAIEQIEADAGGRFVAEDDDAPSGVVRYQLRARAGVDAWASDIETVTVPYAPFTLGVPWPHPVQHILRVTVSLPDPGNAVLDVTDITGRRVARQALNVRAGETTIEMPETARLKAGIYHMRLTQGTRSATRRVAVVR